MQDISVSFRIAVNASQDKIIEILAKYKDIWGVSLQKKELMIAGSHVEILHNEDYEEELSMIDEDRYLYYQSNMDFYPKDDTIMLENQIQLAKEISQTFAAYGIASEIIAEFEHLL